MEMEMDESRPVEAINGMVMLRLSEMHTVTGTHGLVINKRFVNSFSIKIMRLKSFYRLQTKASPLTAQ
jgi:hypothetical protein